MSTHNLRVGFYARVSGEQQAKEDTIASQIEAVMKRVADDALECDPELRFVDDGVSGSILVRPGLERLRDQAAAGAIDRLYVLDPDRFSRKYAYQVLLLEELDHCGVEVVFLRNPPGQGPEQALLLQVQGMIAEYERAKIIERCRRGKQHAARRGSVNVLGGTPTAIATSASTRAAARRVIKSWPKRPGSYGGSSSGSQMNALRSERFAAVSSVMAFLLVRGNRPGTARWSGRCSRTPPTRGRPVSARRARARPRRHDSDRRAAAPHTPNARPHELRHLPKIRSRSMSLGW